MCAISTRGAICLRLDFNKKQIFFPWPVICNWLNALSEDAMKPEVHTTETRECNRPPFKRKLVKKRFKPMFANF